ncbi:PTS sugar transporter subunit IIA [Parapusillimonas granuli]|uniref:PTS sugar transporter subunit IIA n=1 Tax=Parapusillimonas granuli TaxID=380911 RepID=A0A853G812_9BURK|nr:PTS sugar transporter subunit IIA [Parapusillimonas granuli]MBB5214349.1 PTS system ascorbate-specific IIA component [Parapusillimonas granuli]MEB2399162.1 PTS sugar transporter subunit IIA [Alcaligenaceae bacterium]NYT51882.1 PTS sugar transporter subunit IIA [Parapusillimonas granuli]
MARIALVMHEPLGAAFKACAQHVLGQEPELTVFDVPPDADPDELSVRLARILLDHAADPTLILCDIFGATPFNIAKRALKLATERGMVAHLITGTNLCMVLKALTEQQENPEQLSETVRLGALRGIVDADQFN